jgi:hypothetical protein
MQMRAMREELDGRSGFHRWQRGCFLLFLAAVIDFSRGVKDGLKRYCG